MSSILNLSNLKDKITSKLSLQGSSKNQKSGKDSKEKDQQKPKESSKIEKSKESKRKSSKQDKGSNVEKVIDANSKNNADETLRQEALALGATEEDLKLLQGIESDDDKSEIE